MAASCSSHSIDTSSNQLNELLSATFVTSTPSEQHVLAADKSILTTKLCAELGPGNTRARRWFRWAPSSANHASTSTCSAGGAPLSTWRALHNDDWHAWRVARSRRARDAADGGASIPCAVLQQRWLRRHDYGLPAARFDHAPPAETLWVRGLALIGNELHISNFHHFNRDSLFFARSISRLGENASSRISQIVIVDGSDVNGWSTNHARAMLGTLLSRTVFQPKSSGKALQQNKRDLSTATLLPASPSSSSSSSSGFFRNVFASNNPSPAAPKYVCYESALEKLVTWPADRDDLAFVRQRAYEYCGVATAAEKKPARERLHQVPLHAL